MPTVNSGQLVQERLSVASGVVTKGSSGQSASQRSRVGPRRGTLRASAADAREL